MKSIDLPATADAAQGGFVIDTSPLETASLEDRFQGSLHGYWGFEKFDGPGFQLVNTHSQAWTPSSADDGSLIVGRANTIHLQAGSVACIDRIMVKDPAGKELRVEWSPVKANEVEINLPLQQAEPGALTLFVSQFGASEPHPVELRAYPEAGRFESFSIHAGEIAGRSERQPAQRCRQPVAQGTRVRARGLHFQPCEQRCAADGGLEADTGSRSHGPAARESRRKQRSLFATDVLTRSTSPSPRLAPASSCVGKSVQLSARSNDSNIQLASEDQLPQDAQLVFSVRAKSPATFGRDENIEVATEDEAFATTLSLANRGLTLADAKVAVATFDPAKAFGFSAFGPTEVSRRGKRRCGRLAAAGHAGAIAGAAGSAVSVRARQGLQAHGLEPVPGGFGLQRSASSKRPLRCPPVSRGARCPFPAPARAGSI